MFSIQSADDLATMLADYLKEQKCEFKINEKKYKIESVNAQEENIVSYKIKIEKVDENVNCIRLEKVRGDKLRFLEIYKEIKDKMIELKSILS